MKLSHVAAISVLAVGLAAAPGCASDDATQPGTPSADHGESPTISAWTSSLDIAREFGLRSRAGPGSGVTLEDGTGARILLFAGTTVASVAGQTLTLSEAALAGTGDVLVARADADRIRISWRANAAAAGSSPATGYTPGAGAVSLPPPPPPLNRPSSAAPPASAAGPAPATAPNEPTPGEIKAWAVPLKRKWEYLVIHHTASAIGNAAQIHQWHKDKGWDGLGYSFVIGNGTGSGDGAVEVGYRWKQQITGAHAQVPGPSNWANEKGIGICLVGDFNRVAPTAAQMRSLSRLCAFLSEYCGIPPSHLRMHADVKGTDCPGKNFPKNFTFAPASVRARTAAGHPSPASPPAPR